MKSNSKITFALVTLSALVGVSSWADAPVQATFYAPVPGIPVIDLNGNPATSPSTPMGNVMCVPLGMPISPILTPTGQPVTMAQWLGVKGRASAKCDATGTHVVVHLSGLIPN